MSALAFVTVNTVGIPCGHDTAAGAIETHLRDIGGGWNLYEDRRPQIETELQRDGESLFFRHPESCSPMAAGVFDNRAAGFPVAAYTNHHLRGRPRSLDRRRGIPRSGGYPN